MPTTQNSILAHPLPYGSTFSSDGSFHGANNVTLFLIADGYDNASTFISDCQDLVERLALIAPFGDPVVQSIVNVYTCYDYSANPDDYVFPISPDGPSGSLSTPLGSYFQPGNPLGQLHVSYERLLDVGKRIQYWSESQIEYFPLLIETDTTVKQIIPGAIVILMPEVSVGAGATATYSGLSADQVFQVEMEHASDPLAPVYFAATTCNKGFERVAARALALKLGLGDESEQVRGLPSEWVGKLLNTKPNLLYVPDPNIAEFVALTNKWQALTSEAIVLHPKLDSATNAALDEQASSYKHQPIGMWEGGGGYTNGIYRPAHDCLMRRKPGVGQLHLKKSKHPFCPVCRAYLYKTIKGEYSTKRIADFVSLSTQISEYDKITWEQTQVFSDLAPAAAFYAVGKDDVAYKFPEFSAPEKQAFWGYMCHVSDDSANAFSFTNVRVHQSEYYAGEPGHKVRTSSEPRDVRDVFSSIGFRDLKVTFEHGDSGTPADYEFVIADYIRDNKYRLEKSWRGHIGKDNLYQTGWKLRLVEDRPNWPRLEVELSLVMRGPAPDFDPGGIPVALKCYPQIQFKWFRRPNVRMGVQKFDGTVHTVVNVKHYSFEPNLCADPINGSRFVSGHHDEYGNHIPNDFNDLSCFADSNISANYFGTGSALSRDDVAIELLPPPGTKPVWATIFDYYVPHVAQTGPHFVKQFIGVHRYDKNTLQSRVRKMYVKHKVAVDDDGNDMHNDIFITKFARQGNYDNLHVNGYMGKHGSLHQLPECDAREIKQEDLVAAPFCGLDCFHMHWRWSLLSDTIANLTNVLSWSPWLTAPSYRGWNMTNSHSRIGSPLIPPNQQLVVHLEAAVHAEIESRKDKIVECIISVSNPVPGENQVMLEQGMGWAMIYSDTFGVIGAVESTLLAPPIPFKLKSPLINTDDLTPYRDREAEFEKIYDYIRFHHSFDGIFSFPSLPGDASKMKIFNNAQVPMGKDKPSSEWPSSTTDPFLFTYKRFGDAFNLSLYTHDEQEVVGLNGTNDTSIEDI